MCLRLTLRCILALMSKTAETGCHYPSFEPLFTSCLVSKANWVSVTTLLSGSYLCFQFSLLLSLAVIDASPTSPGTQHPCQTLPLENACKSTESSQPQRLRPHCRQAAGAGEPADLGTALSQQERVAGGEIAQLPWPSARTSLKVTSLWVTIAQRSTMRLSPSYAS